MPDNCPNEKALVKGAIAGDADAFGELYMHYLDPIYRYIYFRVDDVDDAEDLTEQVFLQAWEALPGYEPQGYPLSAWLYRIAHNLVVDHHRRKRPISTLPGHIDWERSETHSLEQVIRAEEASMLANAIAKLPEAQQEVIILRFVEGMNHKRVAQILKKSYGASRTIQYRALTALNELLTCEKAGVP